MLLEHHEATDDKPYKDHYQYDFEARANVNTTIQEFDRITSAYSKEKMQEQEAAELAPKSAGSEQLGTRRTPQLSWPGLASGRRKAATAVGSRAVTLRRGLLP